MPHRILSSSLLTYYSLITTVLADHSIPSPSCPTVTTESLPVDCTAFPHCAQPQIVELKTHTIPCGCPSSIPTVVVPTPCPTKCIPLGRTAWTSTLESCEGTGLEPSGHSRPSTVTVDVPQKTVTSKVKCVTITKTDGPSCTVTQTPACPQRTFSCLSTVRVTNYCGCNGIKETTICKTTCKISFFSRIVILGFRLL